MREQIPSSQYQQVSKPKRNKQPYLIALLIVVLLGSAGYGVYTWQQSQVNQLNQQIATLKEKQLPQQKFSSYEDCTNNGGVALRTINGQFDACLGGDDDDTSDIPQHQAFLQYSAQNLPRIQEAKKSKTENRVDNTAGHSAELVSFLKQDYTGCEIGASDNNTRGYYKIVKEVPDRFALLKYGCMNDASALKGDYSIVAIKLGNRWALISPTNNMYGDTPSCLIVDMFKVSKELSSTCKENTGYNNGKSREVTHP